MRAIDRRVRPHGGLLQNQSTDWDEVVGLAAVVNGRNRVGVHERADGDSLVAFGPELFHLVRIDDDILPLRVFVTGNDIARGDLAVRRTGLLPPATGWRASRIRGRPRAVGRAR